MHIFHNSSSSITITALRPVAFGRFRTHFDVSFNRDTLLSRHIGRAESRFIAHIRIGAFVYFRNRHFTANSLRAAKRSSISHRDRIRTHFDVFRRPFWLEVVISCPVCQPDFRFIAHIQFEASDCHENQESSTDKSRTASTSSRSCFLLVRDISDVFRQLLCLVVSHLDILSIEITDLSLTFEFRPPIAVKSKNIAPHRCILHQKGPSASPGEFCFFQVVIVKNTFKKCFPIATTHK